MIDHCAPGWEAHQTVGAVRLHGQTISRLAAVVEGALQATPQADDLAVGTSPLVHDALEDGLAAQRVATHSAQRPHATVVPEGKDGHLTLLTAHPAAHTAGRLHVDVTALRERLQRPRLPGQPGDHARLNRAIVAHRERPHEERADQRLEGLGVGTETQVQVEDSRVLSGLGREARARQVLELEAPARPPPGVRAKETDAPAQSPVHVCHVERRLELLVSGQRHALAQLQDAPLIGGQIVARERLTHRLRLQVRQETTEPGEKLRRAPRVLHARDGLGLGLVGGQVLARRLDGARGQIEVHAHAQIVDLLVGNPHLALVIGGPGALMTTQEAAAHVSHRRHVLSAILDKLRPLLGVILGQAALAAPVRLAEPADEGRARTVLGVGPEGLRPTLQRLRVSPLSHVGHRVLPGFRREILTSR